MSIKVEFSTGDAVLLHNLLAAVVRRNPPSLRLLASDTTFLQAMCKKLFDAIHVHDHVVLDAPVIRCPASKQPWDECTCPACTFPKSVVYDVCKLLRADYSNVLTSLDMPIDAKIGYFMAASCADEQLIKAMNRMSRKNLPFNFLSDFFRAVLLQEGMLP